MAPRRIPFETAFPGVSRAWEEHARAEAGRAAEIPGPDGGTHGGHGLSRVASWAFRVGFLAGGRYISLVRDGLARQAAADMAVSEAIASLRATQRTPLAPRATDRDAGPPGQAGGSRRHEPNGRGGDHTVARRSGRRAVLDTGDEPVRAASA